MLLRRVIVLFAVLGLMQVCLAQDNAPGEPAEKTKPQYQRGEIVRVSDGQLLLRPRAKKGEQAADVTLAIPTAAPVRLERKKARLSDLEPGMSVSVAVDDAGVVKSVNASYPKLVGSFVRLDDKAIVLSVKGAGGEATEVRVPVTARAKVRIDGEAATLADLKPGMHVSVPQSGKAVGAITARAPKAAKQPAKKKGGAGKKAAPEAPAADDDGM